MNPTDSRSSSLLTLPTVLDLTTLRRCTLTPTRLSVKTPPSSPPRRTSPSGRPSLSSTRLSSSPRSRSRSVSRPRLPLTRLASSMSRRTRSNSMASEGFMHSGIWDNPLLWTNVVTSRFLFHMLIVKSIVLQNCLMASKFT